MKIQQIEYFVATVKYGSISAAAKKLYISQPAVSLSIKSLEEEFNCRLFERTGNAVVLTDEGHHFHSLAIKILEEFLSMKEDMMAYVRKAAILKIGIPPMIGTFFLPPLMEGFSSRYPEVNLRVAEYGSNANQKAVEERELDLAITVIANGISNPDLEYEHLGKTHLVFAVSKTSPFASKSCITIDDIAETPLILMKEGCLQNQMVREAFAHKGVIPNIKATTNQLYTIQEMLVSNNKYGAFFFDQMIRDKGPLVGIPFEKPMELDIVLCYRKDADLAPIAKSFVRFCRTSNLLSD